MPTTIGDTTKTILISKNNHTVDIAFDANAPIPLGAPVQLNADGTIEVASATNTAQYIGVCTVPAKEVGDRATIQTKFDLIAKVKAKAAIARNAKLTCHKVDTETAGETVVVTAVATNLVHGHALEVAGAGGDYIQVGFYATNEVL